MQEILRHIPRKACAVRAVCPEDPCESQVLLALIKRERELEATDGRFTLKAFEIPAWVARRVRPAAAVVK
jgi:hypothetical protein